MEDKIKYEKHWLKLLVEGDEKAYKRLFELYYSSLVMFAAKYLRDTDLATAVTFIVIGALFLIDKLIHFSSIGLPWVMNKDNMLLYASICFLIFKRDKSIGFVLLGLWLVMNIGLVMSLLGSLSGYLLPLTLLIIGIVLFWFAKR